MKKIFYICSLLVVLVTLSSCGNKDNGIYPFQEETKYLTVRLQGSDKWSIINVENGDIVAKNAISGIPSAVHEDMVYVYDNEMLASTLTMWPTALSLSTASPTARQRASTVAMPLPAFRVRTCKSSTRIAKR